MSVALLCLALVVALFAFGSATGRLLGQKDPPALGWLQIGVAFLVLAAVVHRLALVLGGRL